MIGNTPRFGLLTLGKDDELNSDDYGFGRRNRLLLDELLTRAVEHHRHTGIPAPTFPGSAPTVTVHPGGGILPANSTIVYRTALVDETGQEHVASQPASVVTPSVLSTPSPPQLRQEPGTSSLQPGEYLYQVTVFTEESSAESLPSIPVRGTLTSGNRWVLECPPLPGGATGWNVYRQGPTDMEPIYLTSADRFDLQWGWEDDGSVTPLPFRTPPVVNTSSSTASVTIDAELPPGFTLKIYRNLDQTDWSQSLVVRTAVLPYTDTGHAARPGQPLARSVAFGGASRIRFGAETEGSLPVGRITHTQIVTFAFAGPLEAGFSGWQWVCDFDEARITSVRGTLGKGDTADRPILFFLQKFQNPYPATWRTLQTTWGSDREFTVEPDQSIGSRAVVEPFQPPTYWNYGDPILPRFRLGDALRTVITQAGSDVQPGHDLTIVVTLAVRHGSTSTGYTWKED